MVRNQLSDMFMKSMSLLMIAFLICASPAECQESRGNTNADLTLYLDQPHPGLTPMVFARDYLSKDCGVYANVTFHPELALLSWTPNTSDDSIYSGGLFVGKKQDQQWLSQREISFLDSLHGHRSPFFSCDGERLYFQAYLKANKGWDQFEQFYYVEKNGETWSKAELLDTMLNKYAVHWQFSLDKQDNLYFSGDLRGKENTGGIYCSRFREGKYEEPVLLFSNQDYGDAVFGPAISPKADYLLFTRIHSQESSSPRIFSLYVSFRMHNSEWEEPLDMGEALKMDANQVRISPDGNYLFYVGNDGYVYWLDSGILDHFR